MAAGAAEPALLLLLQKQKARTKRKALGLADKHKAAIKTVKTRTKKFQHKQVGAWHATSSSVLRHIKRGVHAPAHACTSMHTQVCCCTQTSVAADTAAAAAACTSRRTRSASLTRWRSRWVMRRWRMWQHQRAASGSAGS